MAKDGNSLSVDADEDQFTPSAVLAALFVLAMTLWGLLILAALNVLA